MCTVISHAVVGTALGRAAHTGPRPARVYGVAAALSVLPDADALLLWAGVPYGHMFGHRGFLHSPYCAIVVGLLAVLLFFPVEAHDFRRRGARLWALFALAMALHGVLDAMTQSMLGWGIAFLAPFTADRYFLGVDWLPTPPIGVREFFSLWGARVMWAEIVRIWLPVLGLLGLVEVGLRPRRAG